VKTSLRLLRSKPDRILYSVCTGSTYTVVNGLNFRCSLGKAREESKIMATLTPLVGDPKSKKIYIYIYIYTGKIIFLLKSDTAAIILDLCPVHLL
jgi:hypothetical protein